MRPCNGEVVVKILNKTKFPKPKLLYGNIAKNFHVAGKF